jgi:hypothetical protein
MADHSARFSDLCGSVQIPGRIFHLEGMKDFGGFFESVEGRALALREGKRLRSFICQSA